jgi:hypothetical protein
MAHFKHGTSWLPNSNYFLIGSNELPVTADMVFSHSDVGYRKKRKRTRLQMELNIEATPQKFHFEDVLENGNKAVMAVVILRQKWRNDDNANDMFSRFKSLTGISNDNFESILVTDEIELFIKENLVDIALYSRKTLFNSCSLFLELVNIMMLQKKLKLLVNGMYKNTLKYR